MKKKIHVSGFHEFLGRIFCLCRLWNFFPWKTIAEMLEAWYSVGKKSGEYRILTVKYHNHSLPPSVEIPISLLIHSA